MRRFVTTVFLAGLSIGATRVTADDAVRLAEGGNAFALDVYRHIGKSPGNLVFSPGSLTIALCMAWGGARGATADEMKRVLHFDGTPAETMKASGELASLLTDPRRPVVFRLANRLFTDKKFRLEAAYVEAARTTFGAAVEPVDFSGSAEKARGAINGWVESQTEKRIQDLVPPGGVDRQTLLVLVNAIYFLGNWDRPFDPQATRPALFHTSKTTTKDVPTMHHLGTIGYSRSEATGLRAIELPYKGGSLSMVIVLPDTWDGLPAVEERLTTETFAAILRGLSPALVHLALPRFELRPTKALSLAETLAGLGMPSAFDPGRADFTGLARDRLFIGSVFHNAFVKVDETGTEAAAATAIMFSRGPSPRIEVDHPFLFFIRDTATGLIVFMGRVTDPTLP